MNLKEFFKTHPDVTKRDMATALDTDTATCFGWCKGRTPSLKYALAIESFTKGLVRVADLIGGNVEKEKGVENVRSKKNKRI